MNNKRDEFINNALELSIYSGKINENAKYILYSEHSNIEKKKKILSIKEELKQIIVNVKGIANSLELSIEEIFDINE